MSFSMKAQKPTGGSNVDWKALSDHQLEVIGTETKSRIFRISGLVDLGEQERKPFEEPYDEGKKEHIEALSPEDNRGAKLVIGKHPKTGAQCEMISIPQRPAQQVAIVLDYPELMINYGKFFGKEDEFKPYREVYGGTFFLTGEKLSILGRGISLNCMADDKAPSGYAYSKLNMISKFATAIGKNPTGTLDQDFDLAELIGGVGVITTGMKVTQKGDKTFTNFWAKDPSPKHEMIPVPEINVPTFGISFQGGNDPEMLKQLNAPTKNTIKRALNYEGSAIQKELEALEGGNTSNQGGSEGNVDKTPSQAAQSVTETQTTPKVEASTDFEDFDDDFSFDD